MKLRFLFALLMSLPLAACQRQAPPDVSPPAATTAPAPQAGDSQPDEIFVNPAELTMSYAAQQESFAPGQKAEFAVTVENRGRVGLASTGPTTAYVTYRWLDSNGAVVLWDNPRTPVQSDIAPGQSGLIRFPVVAPKQPGSYILKVVMGLMDGTDFEPSGHVQLHYRVNVQPE